jgi:hypothetical protein
MRLAAGDAPVAVKRWTVEPVNKVKILPVDVVAKREMPILASNRTEVIQFLSSHFTDRAISAHYIFLDTLLKSIYIYIYIKRLDIFPRLASWNEFVGTPTEASLDGSIMKAA